MIKMTTKTMTILSMAPRRAFSKSGALCLTAALTLLSPPAFAQDDASQTQSAQKRSDVALSRLLSSYHELPSRDAFVAASKSAEDDLHRLVRDHATFQARKYRALQALATYWPGERTETLFTELFAATEESDAAIHQLITLSSKHLDPARATALISPYLTASDEQVRYTAVDGLGRIQSKESRELLAAHKHRETSSWVKAHIDRMLIEVR